MLDELKQFGQGELGQLVPVQRVRADFDEHPAQVRKSGAERHALRQLQPLQAGRVVERPPQKDGGQHGEREQIRVAQQRQEGQQRQVQRREPLGKRIQPAALHPRLAPRNGSRPAEFLDDSSQRVHLTLHLDKSDAGMHRNYRLVSRLNTGVPYPRRRWRTVSSNPAPET